MKELLARAFAHANEFEDVRPASCALLRECVAEIERLRREQQDAEELIRDARARVVALRNYLALGYYPLSVIGERIDSLLNRLDRVAAQGGE